MPGCAVSVSGFAQEARRQRAKVTSADGAACECFTGLDSNFIFPNGRGENAAKKAQSCDITGKVRRCETA
eukprot:2343158-Rhodomonas_salina.2